MVRYSRGVCRLDPGLAQRAQLVLQVVGQQAAVVVLEGTQLVDLDPQSVALGFEPGEHLRTPALGIASDRIGTLLSLSSELLGVDASLGLDPIGAGTRVGESLVGLPVGAVDDVLGLGASRRKDALRLDLRLADQTLSLLGGHL
jgi:hypothetical protein